MPSQFPDLHGEEALADDWYVPHFLASAKRAYATAARKRESITAKVALPSQVRALIAAEGFQGEVLVTPLTEPSLHTLT